MNIITNYLIKNRCYKNATKIKVEKLVLHSLGVAQPNADVLIKSWNNPIKSVCVHAFIEEDRIIQTLPWDFKAWHVGSGKKGSYNNCSIAVEICEPQGHKYKGGTMINYDAMNNDRYFKKVYHNAVELFSYLCNIYNLDPLKDIYCHSEVYKLGYGSCHSDVTHWFPKHNKSMDDFRKDVKIKLDSLQKVDSPEKKYTYDYYIIQKGDTLIKIADKFNTTVKILQENNNINKPNMISIGQKIITSKYYLYTVVKDDNLIKISLKVLGDSEKYKLIMKWNNLKTITIIENQILKIKIF